MEDTTSLSDPALLKRIREWRIKPVTDPLPHNADIEPASIEEYQELKREAERRGPFGALNGTLAGDAGRIIQWS